ncbi:MAG: PAS domain-containing protein, partial [Chloroflexi bacterium]|nr:PAS domain-containing protein [Chloroflexota bacterium]
TVLDNLPDPVYMKDAEGREMFSNRADCEANGWREEEIRGKTARELFPGEVGERIYREDMHVLRMGQPILNREERIVTRDGEVRWFSSSKVPFRDASGRIIGLVGIGHDITALREATEALLQSEEEKTIILDNIRELFAYYDLDLRVRLANKAAADSVRQSPKDLVGRHCYEIWHGRTAPCENCPVLRAKETRRPEEGEVTTPDERVWRIRGYPILGEEGEVVALVEFTEEITEKRRLEHEQALLQAQLQQAQKMEAIGRLAGGVAHDFNNMLQSILGYAQLALEELAEDDPLRMYVEEIQAAGQRSASLTR